MDNVDKLGLCQVVSATVRQLESLLRLYVFYFIVFCFLFKCVRHACLVVDLGLRHWPKWNCQTRYLSSVFSVGSFNV